MASNTALYAMLRDELAAALNMSTQQLQLDQSFLAQGGDSLSAIHAMSKLRSAGIHADIVDFLQAKSLSEILAETIARHEADVNALDLSSTGSEDGSTCSTSSPSIPRESLGGTPDFTPVQMDKQSEVELALFAHLNSLAPDSVGHVDSVGPCSSMQNRILISQTVHAAAYHCSFIVTARTRDRAPLSADEMAYLWRSIVARHPSLRTTFIESEERPGNFDQVVWDQVQPKVTILEDADQVNEVQDIPSAHAQVPHHLYLAQISPTELILRLNASHAIVDGRSAGILLRDLCNAISGELSTATSLRHADFALTQDQVAEDSEDFWRSYLHGAEDSYLPGTISNKPKAGLHTLQGVLSVPAHRTRTFCDKYGVTLVNVCQVAWGTVLRSFALKEDVSFSYVTSGRQTNLQGMHEAVGLFISSLVLRMDFVKNTKVLDMLRATNRDVLRGMLHDNGLQRKTSKWGNSILSFQRAWESESNENDPLRLKVLQRLSPTDYDHSVNVELGHDTISVDYGIWKSTSDTADANKILAAFLRAIAFILANPEAELGDMDVLGDNDLKRLQEVNGIPPKPCSTCIHTLVEEMAVRQPDAMAICAWDGTMTYRALDQAANKLAYRLVDLGVGPEVIVGACMEKSRWMAVSTLAVLKAGGVVLPLSVQQPLARMEIVLKDTRARIVLADTGQMTRLGREDLPDLHLIRVDTELLDGLDSVPDGQIVCSDVGTTHAAWIVYTSGSTGVPKGVVLQHSALCSSIKSHGAAFGVTRESRVLQFASHTFDVMIQETFTTLCQGGCVCIPSEQARLNSLEDAILSMEVNFLSLTSTVAGLLNPAKLPKIRAVLLMGEPVKPATLDLWMDSAVVLESYAPSECSIYATCSPEAIKSIKQASVLGEPLSSCFWVVEPKDRNRLVPIGAPGELLIEGPLLARGYLNDMEKTKQSFIMDPDFIRRYKLGSGRRMYCTGDLVRQNDNGTYSTLGRRDMQINIRGQRVEIGEVEYHITQRAPGTQAVIVLSQHDFENGRLVAAFSLSSNGAPAYNSLTVEESGTVDKSAAMLIASDIQHYLAQHVPDYMIPRIWVPVAKLPVNTSGKVDRRAVFSWINSLSNEDIASFADFEQSETDEDLPATATERQIRKVWSTVLNIPLSRISYRRSFLSYSGDSITAMQVVSACRKLGLTLSVRMVLQSRAISELALGAGNSVASGPADIQDEPFNLAPAQRMYFDEIAPAGIRTEEHFRYNQSVCLVLQGSMSQAKVARSIEALVAKHAMLRARFYWDPVKGWQQRIDSEVVGCYRFQAHSVESDDAAQKVMQHSQGSLDIEHGPVFATNLIDIETPGRQILFLTAHHLVVDLMSWRIIVQDLEQLFVSGTTDPSLSMPFPTWFNVLAEEAQHLVHDTTASNLTNERNPWTYWGLQSDQYTSADAVFTTAEIDEETTRLLLGPTANSAVRSTPADILLAGLLLSFRNVFSDRDYPTIFTEGHGRDTLVDCDLSDTVGWFTTITPLHFIETGDSSPVSALKQVKELRRMGVDRHVLEFAKIYLKGANRGASTSHSSREIMFNYQGQFQQLERAGGVLRLDRLHQTLQDPQSSTSSIGSKVKMQAALNVEAFVEAGRTQIRVGYCKSSPKGDAIREWALEYSRVTVELVHELLRISPTATPSDFPLAGFTSDVDLVTMQEQCLLPAQITSWQDVEDILPCSAMQQGIILSQMKSSSTYWLKQTCRVHSMAPAHCVDTGRLADAWRKVIRQHSIMRTIFTATPVHGDRFYQVVLKSPVANIVHTTCADADVQQCIKKHPLQDDRPGQPLHQFLIITTTDGNIYGHFEISHALVDASSVQLLVDALLTAYEERSVDAIHGSEYSTYISYLETTSQEDDLQYWKNLLAAAEPCYLNSDQNLGAVSSEVVEALPSVATAIVEDISALYEFCRLHNFTVANVVQTAWALVLSSRVDATNQVSFGYLSSGRDVPIDGVETLIGPMINIMICHFDMQSMAQLTPAEAVQSVQDRFLEGFEHQRASLAAIQHSLKQSLFNTTVSYRRAPGTADHKQADLLRLEKIAAEESTEYDFNLHVLATESGLELSMQYWPMVASSGATQRLLAQFKHLLGALCTNATVRLCDLEFLSPEDELAIKTKNEVTPVALDDCIHSMAGEVVKRQPDAIAIHAWDGKMSYGELDNVASRLGQYLATRFGIGPEVKVGICMDKSRWAIVAMFATLKAGGVVLPLSTQQPHARLRLVLDDTQAPIVLVDAGQAERLSDLGPHLIKIDESLLDQLPSATEITSPEVRPDNAAWIVYTSGSTGIPKGVVLQHSALCTSLIAHGTAFTLGAGSRVLQFASHTFDVTIQEVFTTLFFGGCVCVPAEADRLDNLEHAIIALEVNFLSLTSTVAGLLEPNNLPDIEKVVLLGEPVNPLVLEKWIQQATVLGAYGPSECSIQVTTSSRPFTHRRQAPVLGVPLASNFWVVDPQDASYERLCPIGAPGELLIEGPLLAREYLNDPDKTRRSFVVDPGFLERYHIGASPRRMYRTGDLVRQNNDGTYTILGRRDTQIKIRGQRVEIGEVEYHIARHSSHVHAAVVLSQRSDFDDKKLVAAFSLPSESGYNSTTIQKGSGSDKPGAMLVASDIQHYLSQHLPDYMIPRIWIPLNKLPVNSSGKIDRLSVSKYVNDLTAEELASYSELECTEAEEDELPATQTERQIRQIWSDVLNVPVTHIAYRRSFLSYGGDSITAMQVVSACRKKGLVLTVRDVLQSNAVSELALMARKGAVDGRAPTEIPDEPFDLSPAQRMYFQDIAVDGLRSQGQYRFNQSVCFRLQLPIQQHGKIARAVEALTAKHAMLRARFKTRCNGEKGWQQRIEKQLVGSYHFQTRITHNDEMARSIIQATQASLDLEHGPVFAADFLEMPDRQLLFLTAHHLVVDLMSWRIIAQDLEQLLRSGTVSASCAVQFPAWCSIVTQRAQQCATTKVLTAPSLTDNAPSWAYWGLKYGQYMWADQTFATAQVDEQTTSLLLGAANGALRTSPADILLTALYQSFREVFTDRSDPAVFVENHGRGSGSIDCDLSETVGWFTTLTPLRLSSREKDGGNTLALLKQAKDSRKLDAGGQELEFALRYVTEHDTAAGPIEVLFNYHGQFQQLEREDSLLRLDKLHQPAAQSDTSSVGGRVKMQAAFNVEVSVESGKAVISIGFSRYSAKQEAIRQWTSKYVHYIAKAVNVLGSVTPMATASDFPLAHLTNSDLVLMEQRCLNPAGVAWEDVEDILPCSPVQQGILLSQLISPSTYHLRETCRILPTPNATSHRVDTSKLAVAWAEVVQRHSIMRTIFTSILHQDRFYQVVLQSPKANVRIVGCATEADVQECIDIHTDSEHQPGRPQHQFLLVATAKEGHVYGHFEISHALVDASSIQILVESLLLAYEGVTAIPRSTYSTYVSFLEDHSEEDDVRYWQDLLAKAEPCILQLNHAPFAQPTKIETEPVVSVELQNLPELQRFCRTNSVTVANVIQLAWSLVLASCVGSRQVSFGYLASGRDVPINGVHTLIGPMINMMICHCELDYDMTPSQATRKVQDRFFEGFERQRAPLAAIQHTLHPSQRPLFNTTVSYRRIAPSSTSAQSIQLERVDAAESTDYDFNLSIMASDSSIELVLQYSLDTSAGAAYRLLCQLKHTVAMLCSSMNTTSRLGDLELLSPEDEHVIKNTNTERPVAVKTCIHSIVQGITAQQPNAEAICAWDGTMTYQELDDAASRLAYYLSILGVGPEIMVGMCMDKSRWAAVSLLAILKAGGVVLPLSTQQPLNRLSLVLEDTKAPIILVDTIQDERLARIGPQLIKVDSAMLNDLSTAPWVRAGFQPPLPQVETTNAAWVVYTSGSTGQPKGVVLQHSALCTSIEAHGAAFGVGSHSRVLQFAAHTFDVTIQEIFTTLCRGGCVCIPSEEQRLNSLEPAIRTMAVNFLSLTSTIAGLLNPTALPAVQTVILMGEPVKPAVLDLWKHVIVLESYAPSECSIYATCSPRSMTHHKQVPVLGVPLASCFWVVDPTNYNRLCPIGTPGELLIEGPLLARGYLNDEVKTQNSFIVNPGFLTRHGLQHGQCRRMYRTGDLVRQNEDGTFTTLGRRDMQVKIWGQRVEVGEIEYWTVRSHPMLCTAAAMLAQLGTARDQGVLAVAVDFTEDSVRDMDVGADADGFLKPSTTLMDTLGQVRSSLIEILPRYMVPELFVPMANLPFNTSGKLDRRAIQEAITTLSSQGGLEAYLPTSTIKADVNTETGRELRRLWAEVLGRPATTIGADDNFFHAGGDSLMAMRLVQLSRDAPFSLTVADIFEHPCLSDLAKNLEGTSTISDVEADGQELAPFSLWTELSPERPDALHSVVDEVAGRCAIAPEQIEDVYPCTPLQEGLMLATSRRPTAYVSRRLFTLDDAIDAPRLRDAWQQMGKAAPILRTRILLGRSAGSIQIVVNEDIPWQMSDTLDSYLDEDRAVGMAEGQPLVRLGLIVPPIGKRHFVFTAHHSVYDGWSMQLMYQQVAALYRREETPDLVPFTRFITYLDSANDEMAAEYWREQLTGDVTSDFPPLPQAKYQPLPTQRRTQQIEFGHRSRSTVPLPILLRAAWGILAAQHAGTSDIAFAATLSGRNAPIAGMTEMLAPTITTVPLRLHIDTSLTVRCFLKKLQRQATKMIPFEHTGLQRIKELVPDLASAVDIRHLFVVQPSMGNDDSATFPGMAPEPSAGETFDSFALTVECFLSPDTNQVTVEARFDQAIVSVRRMERMLESFARIAEQLDQAEQDPNQGMRISDIQTLSTSDLNQILVKNEQVPPKAEGLLHDLILKTAAQEPQHEAVSAWDGSLTYAELVRWSARLADYLAAIGVRPEVKVGLCMAKSRWAVVSMLAILRAGGTVVPIGVQLPFARIQHIIHDAAARIVLTDEQHIARLNSMGTELLKIEPSFLKTLTTSSIERPSTLRPQPSSAAWVVYTSGSTGMPKGVVLEHGSLCASTTAHGAAFGLNSDTRALQFASYTFDASIQEIFTTLRYGGCVCVPSEGQRMDELQTCIAAMGVDFLSLTSTVANFLDPVSLPAVKTLVLLGEPVKPAVLDLWMDHVTVFNGYGPTECTIYSSCSPPITHKKHASLLGSPLSGCFWVVDSSDYNRLCPIGVHGELLIEGPLLARGYLNDPFKTNCSFVTDPRFVSYHGLGSGRRMYCTGDLVRQNEDNTYSIFGRKDTQVKIRGQRVEFGEIEYWVARSLSQVRQAAAMLVSRDAGRDEGTLVVAVELDKSISSELAEEYPDGMLAPSKALQASFDEIRDKLMEVLPRYMLPDMLIPMANLPLNSSGKLDRRALQQAMVSMSAAKFESYRSTFAAKDTTPEAGGQAAVGLTQELQSLWAKVLRKREAAIGLDDNFFNLGADSMSAMQLVAAARKAGLKLTVAQVFRNPVLRDLCRSIEHSDSPERRPVAENDNELTDASTRLAITSALAGRKVETIFETTDFQALAMSEHTVGNAGLVLYMTIAFDRKVDKGAVWTAYQHAVTTTEALRTMFVQHNDRTYQVVLGGFTGPLEECTASGSLTQFCQSLIENDQRKCLPMSEPPLKSWLAEGTSSDNFIVRLSHAQYDGLSLPLLLKELDGHESVLNMDGSPTRQMSYYISGLRSLDKKPAIEYWRGLLDQSRMPVLSTKSKHGDQRMKGTAATSVIPSLKQHHDGVTSATYVKAAWAMALARLNGETDIVFGHLISGRSVPLDDIDKVNGPCVNLIPIRVRTAAAWETVLGQVQDQQISTLPYEHLGFETIFKECTSWPLDPNQRPRFSTILQYQNLPDMCQRGSMHGAECRITYEATPANITDIWVSVEPKGDELHIFAGYFEDVVHSTVVQRLLDDFSQTLRSVQ